MRKLLSLPLVLFLVSTAFSDGIEWFKGTFEEAKAAAQKEGKLIIIDFYSDGCGGSRLLDQQFFGDSEIAKFIHKNFFVE